MIELIIVAALVGQTGEMLDSFGHSKLDESTCTRPGQAADEESILVLKHRESRFGVVGSIWSDDESIVLTWSGDGTARIWRATDGKPLRSLEHDDYVRGATFTDDEQSVLTWSNDGTARLWEFWEPESVQLYRHDAAVYGAQFNKDESLLLTWSGDGTARLWLTQRDEPWRVFHHELPILGAEFVHEGKSVLTWSQDGTARLWDIANRRLVRTFDHESSVFSVTMMTDGTRFLTTTRDKAVLWALDREEPIRSFAHEQLFHFGGGALFNHDESLIITWGVSEVALVWDESGGEPIRTLEHDGNLQGASFLPDTNRVLTWSADQTARIWDLDHDEPILLVSMPGSIIGAILSPDGTKLLTWTRERNRSTATVFLVSDGSPVGTYEYEGGIREATFDASGGKVMLWANSESCGHALIWELRSDSD